MNRSEQNKSRKRCWAVVQRLTQYIQKELLREDTNPEYAELIKIPSVFFEGLSDAEIEKVCCELNERKNFPAVVGRHNSGVASPTYLRKMGLPEEHCRIFENYRKGEYSEYNAVRVHSSVKAPLSEFLDCYVVGNGICFSNCQMFVAKVTHVIAETTIDLEARDEAELTASVIFFIDHSGKLRTPRKPFEIKGERCFLRYLLGRLTKEELAQIKSQLRLNPNSSTIFKAA